MTIKLNDEKDLQRLREEINAALSEAIGQHRGLEFHAAGCVFEPDGSACLFTLDVAREGAPEKWERDAARAFRSYAKGGSFEGLGLEHLGRIFQHDDENWTLIGYKPRAQNNTMLVRREKNGGTYRFSEQRVAAGMAKAKTN